MQVGVHCYSQERVGYGLLAGAKDRKTNESANITKLRGERWPKHALAGIRLDRESKTKASALRSILKHVPNHRVVVVEGKRTGGKRSFCYSPAARSAGFESLRRRDGEIIKVPTPGKLCTL